MERFRVLLSVLLILIICLTTSSNEIKDCCSYVKISPNDLLNCVNLTITNNFDNIHSALPPFGPTLTFTILSRSTTEIREYAAFSHFSQVEFAETHGYHYLPLFADSATLDFKYHRKLVPIMEAMMQHAIVSDYVVWMDADLSIVDMNMKIEDIISGRPDAFIYISADVSSFVNTGMMIFRNHPWTLRFLRDWHQLRERPDLLTEQLGFEYLYKYRNVTEMKKRVAILPPHRLNSEAPPMGRFASHHQILHLAAESNEYRRRVFEQLASNICAKNSEKQLGITKKYLQDAAVGLYFEQTLSAINDCLKIKRNQMIDMEPFYRLRQSASKFSHAMKYANGERETSKSLYLRLLSQLITNLVSEVQLTTVSTYDYNLSKYLSMQKRDEKLNYFEPFQSFHRSQLNENLRNLIESFGNRLTSETSGNIDGISDENDDNIGDWQALQSIYQTRIVKLIENLPKMLSPTKISDSFREKCMKSTKKELSESEQRDVDVMSKFVMSCISSEINQIYSQLPELLKLSAELSFDTFTAVGDLRRLSGNSLLVKTFEDSISSYLVNLVDLLHHMVSKDQHNLIKDMKAGLHAQIGQMLLTENPPNLMLAIDNLHEAIRIYEVDLAGNYLDQRAYAHALSLLANALCMNRQFSQGLEAFEKSIAIEATHTGQHHFQLVEKYANAGQCAVQSFNHDKAKIFLDLGLASIDNNPQFDFTTFRERIETQLKSVVIGV